MGDPDAKERGAGIVLLCYTGVLLGVGIVYGLPFFFMEAEGRRLKVEG